MLLPKTPFSKGNHFGLALSQSSLRAIKTDNEGKVIAEAEVLLEDSLIVGSDLNQELLRTGLLELMKKAQFGMKYAAVCIPEKYAFSREHTFPGLSLSEVDEAIQWQIDKIFPFSAQEIYADWKLIEKSDQEIRVLITVIPKVFLESLKNGIQAAGIFPISFEPSATALLRLLPKGSDKGLKIILELNTHDASATLVVDGVSTLTTTSVFSPNQDVAQTVNYASSIVQDLYSYLDKIDRKAEMLQLYVTGEHAPQELTQAIASQLGIEILLLEVPSVSPKNHLAYSVGAVDVMRSASEQSINLLPTALQAYYDAVVTYDYSKIALRLVSMFVVASVLLAGGVYALSSFLVGLTKQERDLAIQSQTEVKPEEVSAAEVSKNVSRLTTLFPLKKSPERFLRGLYDLTPQNIQLQQVTYTGAPKRVTLLGMANSREEILEYKAMIEASELYERVSLPLSTFEQTKEIPFTMEFFISKEAI